MLSRKNCVSIDTPREQRGNHDVLPLGNELYDLVTKC